MKLPRRARILAFALSVPLFGCSSADEDEPLVVEPGCSPLATSDACLLPFPSSFHQRKDPTSPTGVRMDLRADRLPLRDGDTELDVAPYNLADGVSPAVPILVHFGVDVDTDPLPDQHEVAQSLEEGSPIAVFNMDTGKRVMYFAELDENRREGYDGRYALIIRPLEPMAMGARHAVLIKNDLRDKQGRALPTSRAFNALRDGAPTGNEQVEAARAEYEEIFNFAEAHGYARESLLVAWDFRVASRDFLLGSVLSMRDEALKEAGTTGLGYTITKVTPSPNEHTAKIIEGDFEVPSFLRDDDTFEYDQDHHPVRQAKNRTYPFTMLVPKKAESGEPLPLVVLGHGIFGEGRDFLTNGDDGAAIQRLANEFGAVAIATDWIGLSGKDDIVRIGTEVAANLDRLSVVTDQLQQSLINTLVMTKLARGALQDDPQVKVGTGKLIDLTRTWYWGASLGGIQGSGFVALSDDVTRAVFGVPGSAWCTMISRSIVFKEVQTLLEPHYPDPISFTIALSILQTRFDNVDPVNLSKLMFESPLPDAPPGRLVALQESIGDSQVPNMTTELLARAMGVKRLTPSVSEVFGLEPVTAPTKESVLVQYRLADYDKPFPPESNVPPSEENNVHHDMNFLDNVHLQIGDIFLKGEVNHYCEGPCDPE